MWYVKDEFSKKIYFKSDDVRKTQDFATYYNGHRKFSSQRMFHFVLNDGAFCLFIENKLDVNACFKVGNVFDGYKYAHPFAIKDYHKRHLRYVEDKIKLFRKLCKKHHLWSYNGSGRKADGFDF